eukprot:gnl/TRDRNA2_/TRDRNA2_129500_c1_seq2.p1 gnl/TRDRNA2_/TRDRNA2_129500_c1~~gnl/TRDRNA2_/TRDRNA2_129500_c1_seq2.p1  ORF type:complete len:582 (-),score=40.31 gnl/TRDRNA2_/TRDRNA2_129500_c1_seq2:130-1650(-)
MTAEPAPPSPTFFSSSARSVSPSGSACSLYCIGVRLCGARGSLTRAESGDASPAPASVPSSLAALRSCRIILAAGRRMCGACCAGLCCGLRKRFRTSAKTEPAPPSPASASPAPPSPPRLCDEPPVPPSAPPPLLSPAPPPTSPALDAATGDQNHMGGGAPEPDACSPGACSLAAIADTQQLHGDAATPAQPEKHLEQSPTADGDDSAALCLSRAPLPPPSVPPPDRCRTGSFEHRQRPSSAIARFSSSAQERNSQQQRSTLPSPTSIRRSSDGDVGDAPCRARQRPSSAIPRFGRSVREGTNQHQSNLPVSNPSFTSKAAAPDADDGSAPVKTRQRPSSASVYGSAAENSGHKHRHTDSPSTASGRDGGPIPHGICRRPSSASTCGRDGGPFPDGIRQRPSSATPGLHRAVREGVQNCRSQLEQHQQDDRPRSASSSSCRDMEALPPSAIVSDRALQILASASSHEEEVSRQRRQQQFQQPPQRKTRPSSAPSCRTINTYLPKPV